MLAWIPTVLAISIGLAWGLAAGGRIDHLLAWRPVGWPAAIGGLLAQLAVRATGWSGWWVTLIDIVAMVIVLSVAAVNIRTPGMVVIALGLVLNLVPTVANWGMPVHREALVTAGLVAERDARSVEVTGPRVIDDDASLAFLGERLALPTRQVISLGDMVVWLGIILVGSALVRGRHHVGGGQRGTISYRDAIKALGEGPAPRRGRATHPVYQDDSSGSIRNRRSRRDRPGQSGP